MLRVRKNFKEILVSGAFVLLISFASCTSMTCQTSGRYVDDSTITASVKAKSIADKAAHFTPIDINTTDEIVALKIIVESPTQQVRAEQLVG